jgi:dihydropyrimidinase
VKPGGQRISGHDFGFHMNHHSDEQSRLKFRTPRSRYHNNHIFTAYNGRLRLQDGDLPRLRIARENGLDPGMPRRDVIDILVAEALAEGHTAPEWHALTRPAWGAVEAVLRSSALAAQASAPLYIVHMNVAGEVDQLQYARQHSLPVMGETCPQYLFFTIDHMRRPDGAKWICSPPMRTAEDNERIWQGLADGTIQVVATDHCPFFYDGTKPILYEGQPVAIPGKELGASDFTKIPNGLPAVGDRLPVLWTFGVGSGRISANQFVALTSTNPAKIFGLYPRKGSLVPGADADLAIWDPERKLTLAAHAHHRTDYNLFEGFELTGFRKGSARPSDCRWRQLAGTAGTRGPCTAFLVQRYFSA